MKAAVSGTCGARYGNRHKYHGLGLGIMGEIRVGHAFMKLTVIWKKCNLLFFTYPLVNCDIFHIVAQKAVFGTIMSHPHPKGA